jgi:hypothetical protein
MVAPYAIRSSFAAADRTVVAGNGRERLRHRPPGRPDFSKPPASDLLGQVFDLKQLEALPPAQAGDLPWLMDWVSAANGVYKSNLVFGIARPVSLQTDAAALQRNFTDYEDQEAAASNFLLRIEAREIQAAFAFMDQLAPAQRTPVRMAGLNKMRAANAETLVSYLGCIVPGMKPANARLVSAPFATPARSGRSPFCPRTGRPFSPRSPKPTRRSRTTRPATIFPPSKRC